MFPPVKAVQLRDIKFIKSAPSLAQAPNDAGLEVAFVGRSNAGKSSAINTIFNRSGLAKTSKTPGRTQLLNFFSIDDDHRIVDLPGYGFARVTPQVRNQIERMLTDYLTQRQSLVGVFLMIDIRRDINANDETLIELCAEREIPVRILLTKCDKLSRSAANLQVTKMHKELAKYGFGVQVQAFSSLKNFGVDFAIEAMLHWFEDTPS